jgi:hypothetical protein
MKSAIQELIDNLDNTLVKSIFERLEKDGLFKKALEKEKEQIIDFTNSFYDDCVTEGGSLKQSAEEYYNQTYNQNES